MAKRNTVDNTLRRYFGSSCASFHILELFPVLSILLTFYLNTFSALESIFSVQLLPCVNLKYKISSWDLVYYINSGCFDAFWHLVTCFKSNELHVHVNYKCFLKSYKLYAVENRHTGLCILHILKTMTFVHLPTSWFWNKI